MKSHWSDRLTELGACTPAVEWARRQTSLAVAWKKCKRGDWMLWLLSRLSGEPGSDARKKLCLATCDCAEQSAHLATSDGQMAIALCLTITRDWANGGASDIEDVRAAAYAAYAAAHAAADAAYAADAAAYVAAYDAAYAANAAAGKSHLIEAQWNYYNELLHFDDIAEKALLGEII